MRKLIFILNYFQQTGINQIPVVSAICDLGWEVVKIKNASIPPLAYNEYCGSYWTLPMHRAMLRMEGGGNGGTQKACTSRGIDTIFLGITAERIYTPGLPSIFGESYPSHNLIVISTHELLKGANDEGVIKNRIKKVIIHEAGHLLGLSHCPNFKCPMSSSDSVFHLDEKDHEYCSGCKANMDSSPKKDLYFFPECGKFIYSEAYYANLEDHIFPVEKYRAIYKKLLADGFLSEQDFIRPEYAKWDDLAILLTPEYLDDLRKTKRTPRTISSEIPINKEVIDASRLVADGTFKAGEEALRKGFSFNISGGFHHAYPDHAEGFCYINDVSYAVMKLKKEGKISKSAIIDCDLHQGNGTAWIFRNNPDVFTFSIHQENNYPPKEKSDLDIGLEDFVGDDVYLAKMRRNIPPILEFHNPDIVFYLAGGDPYMEDQLGGLNLTMNGLLQRDQIVIEQCWKRGIPLVVVPAGGYARKFEDTVQIHINTIKACLAAYR